MGFSDNLKLIIKNRNLKQAELCRMTGIQTSLMSDYLGGKKSPTIGNAVIIADALSISLDTLVGKETSSTPEKQQREERDLSPIQQKLISEIEQMDEADLVAVISFMSSLEEYKKSFVKPAEKHSEETKVFRAARSETNAQPEILNKQKDILLRLKSAPKVTSDEDL